MANAKHSPAPWTAHPIEKAHGLPYVPVAAETLIARVYSKHFGDDEQAAANGRLIAAAPEMLDALQRLLTATENLVPNLDLLSGTDAIACTREFNQATSFAALALGKATGSAS